VLRGDSHDLTEVGSWGGRPDTNGHQILGKMWGNAENMGKIWEHMGKYQKMMIHSINRYFGVHYLKKQTHIIMFFIAGLRQHQHGDLFFLPVVPIFSQLDNSIPPSSYGFC